VTLAAGSRLGPYEVLAPLGAGGMGEVYRARDTRLEREVAIKVLPAELAGDVSRLKRFEKEARSASGLNHPNIVTVYDIGSEGGVSYIAMEKVEGETLRKLLVGGAMAVKRLLSIAIQIAEGLSKAHEAGIVHRDLKPENVMVTKDGLVKILDFGLAKPTHVGSSSDEASHLPTETGTSPGMIVGTVGYMSPEQASGELVDFRSDQFAFGSILYELTTGKRAFLKKTGVDTLSAILNEEPEPIGSINPQVPAPLRWIAERCHAKDPERRYGTTRDLAIELSNLRERLAEASGSGAAAAVSRKRSVVLPLAVLGALLAGATVATFKSGSLGKSEPPRFRQLTFSRGAIQYARFAPDGQTIVYGFRREIGPMEIFTTRPGATESRPLGLPPGNILSVSRSGELALLLGENMMLGTLARAPLGGGAPREILERVRGADWAPDGGSLAVVHSVGATNRIEFPIGHVLYEGQENLGNPRVSPKSGLIAVAAGDSVVVIDAKGSKKNLPFGPMGGGFAWSPTGEEIWFGDEVSGVTSIRAGEIGGRNRPLVSLPGSFLVQDVSRSGAVLVERVSWEPSMIGLIPGDTAEHDLTWLDGSMPADISADGRLVLFTESAAGGGPARSVYLWKADGAQAVRLGDGNALALSPDGHWALANRADARGKLFLLPTGPGEGRELDLSGVQAGGSGRVHTPVSATFFPDGQRILVTGFETGRARRLYVVDLAGGKPRPIGPEGAYFTEAVHGVSPDGKTVAALGPDGVPHLFPVEGSAGGTMLTIPGVDGGEVLRWCSDGKCVFLATDDVVDRVDVRTGRRERWRKYEGNSVVTSDGKWYVRSFYRYRSNLFLVDGVK
jgi:serine/threonine protein kinase